MWQGGPNPGADLAGLAQSWRRSGRVGPIPAQMWAGVSPVLVLLHWAALCKSASACARFTLKAIRASRQLCPPIRHPNVPRPPQPHLHRRALPKSPAALSLSAERCDRTTACSAASLLRSRPLFRRTESSASSLASQAAGVNYIGNMKALFPRITQLDALTLSHGTLKW